MRRVTIGAFARAAGVGVETVRYYQRRGLLPVPPTAGGAYRRYDDTLVQRVRLIKQAQAAGFSLADIRTLLLLDPTTDRSCIQRLAAQKLTELTDRLRQLEAVAQTLRALLQACQQAPPSASCPLLATGLDREAAANQALPQEAQSQGTIADSQDARRCLTPDRRPLGPPSSG